MTYLKTKLVLLLIIILILPGFGLRCVSKEVRQGLKPITLNYWRVWDDYDAFADIIAAYQAVHPNITINYRKLRYEEYEKELLDAFAEDRGPDIYSIHNTWMREYQTKIAPMPAEISLVYPVIKGSLKKEIVPEVRTNRTPSTKDIRDRYVDAVASDVIIRAKDEKTGALTDRIYGLPYFVDTLAMYYNRDLLNNAGIPSPPAYWNRDFQQNVKKMTKQDTKGQIIQSGVALGGSANIERSIDILSVLMMQNGTNMMGEEGRVTFHTVPDALRATAYNPGLEALRFYTDFANPAKEVYSWNKTLDNSLDLFVQGKLALFFGYTYHLPIIRARAPKLNFSVGPLPQIEGNPQSINIANYWVETVSKKSKNAEAAWDFILFAAGEKNVKKYLDKAKHPTALRGLVTEQKDDLEIGVFVDQVLTARSWYRGHDAGTTEEIMNQMIDDTVSGQQDLIMALNLAAKKVQQTVE